MRGRSKGSNREKREKMGSRHGSKPPLAFGVHDLVAGGRQGMGSPSPASIWATPASSPGDFSPSFGAHRGSVTDRGHGIGAARITVSNPATTSHLPPPRVACSGEMLRAQDRGSARTGDAATAGCRRDSPLRMRKTRLAPLIHLCAVRIGWGVLPRVCRM